MSESMLRYCFVDSPQPLPRGAVLRPLRVNRDARGVLVETLRSDWIELYGAVLPFAQSYYSITGPGLARDEDRWHLHERQWDRFAVVAGCIVVALAEPGSEAPVTLVPLGPELGDERQAALLVPPGVLHAFVVVSAMPAILLNSPTRLYDPTDEGRVPFHDTSAHFADGTPFAWSRIRSDAALRRLLRG